MDFTLHTYQALLDALLEAHYTFVTVSQAATTLDSKTIVLRHDVDLLPYNSLQTAIIEHSKGIQATYYFRAVPESWDEKIIRDIAELGHEIGYHYESLTTTNGNVDEAYQDFCTNLQKLRQLVPVTSICMHGSPASPYDSKDIWKKYDYKALGIIAEPYFDTDFSQYFYLTDTGRRWDGYKVSVRDRIPKYQDIWKKNGLTFHTTKDIIKRVDTLPKRIMITIHPQRWNNFGTLWLKEAITQRLKNIIKYVLIKFAHSKKKQ